jgi:ribonuclease HII
VLAKVAGDQMMEDLDRDYHGYGFAAHKGYGTAAHLDALRKLGPTSQHRKSFKWSKTSLASLFRA